MASVTWNHVQYDGSISKYKYINELSIGLCQLIVDECNSNNKNSDVFFTVFEADLDAEWEED